MKFLFLLVGMVGNNNCLFASCPSAIATQTINKVMEKNYRPEQSTIHTPLPLPSKKTFIENMQANHYEHFMEHSSIIQKVADQTASPVEVLNRVEKCLYEYEQNVGRPMLVQSMWMNKWEVVEIILLAHPHYFSHLYEEYKKDNLGYVTLAKLFLTPPLRS